MLWVTAGYLLGCYLTALVTRLPARTAVSLANAGYITGPNAYALALAVFVSSPWFVPLACSFIFFATRPVAAARWGGRLGVEVVPVDVPLPVVEAPK